ncbi:MAG: hypothetical protein KAV82_02330 [Phycisphaerae bacterium]|nr:hypothetical protein [Phycisphaerae bacterium]
MAGAKLRDPVVVDVTIEGLTLGRNASPEEVAFALLKAIKEDMDAGGDQQAREKALDKQFKLAAPSAIHRQHVRAVGAEHASPKKSLYKTVKIWTPTLGHYANNFNFTLAEAKQRMQRDTQKNVARMQICKSGEAHVLLEVQDPSGDPNASVIIRIRLVQEEGRWRVWWVGYDWPQRHLATVE